jgi:hypothetical protein
MFLSIQWVGLGIFVSLSQIIWFLDDRYKQLLKDIGNGLSLVSVQNLRPSQDLENKSNTNNCPAVVVQKEEILQEIPSIQLRSEQIEEIDSSSSSYRPTEQEKFLFEKVWNNRMRIQMQHQQLMMKAAKLCFSSINNDTFFTKNNQTDLQTMNFNTY